MTPDRDTSERHCDTNALKTVTSLNKEARLFKFHFS